MKISEIELFGELIKAHRLMKKNEVKFKALAIKGKGIMKKHKISIWENSSGSILIKQTASKRFNKELLEKAGIKYDTFCQIKKGESFNVSHK